MKRYFNDLQDIQHLPTWLQEWVNSKAGPIPEIWTLEPITENRLKKWRERVQAVDIANSIWDLRKKKSFYAWIMGKFLPNPVATHIPGNNQRPLYTSKAPPKKR